MDTTTLQPETVGAWVAKDYRTAAVFRRHGIDFCCGGGKPVSKAAQAKGVDPAQLEAEIAEAVREKDPYAPRFDLWSAETLARYIVDQHHNYVKDAAPRIAAYTAKVAQRHGDMDATLIDIHTEFVALADELYRHMEAEENELFPNLDTAPMERFEDDHEEAGRRLERLRQLTNGFNPPDWACTTFRVSFKELEDFERDLHRHVHLENNILFPKVRASRTA